MKKKYLTYAGVIAAVILFILFLLIFLIKSPILFLIPVTTVDPIIDQNVDANNILILSGKTNLPKTTIITPYINPLYSSPVSERKDPPPVIRGSASILPQPGGWNSWSGIINISGLNPGAYEICLNRSEVLDGTFKVVEMGTVSKARFTLGNASCPDCIKQRVPVISPFIRINQNNTSVESPDFNGVTNLVPGTCLTYNIRKKAQAIMKESLYQEGYCTVSSGLEGVNRWSCHPDISGHGPGRYLFTIFADTRSLSGNNPGNVSETREFAYTGTQSAVLSPKGYPDMIKGATPYLIIDDLPYMKINNVYVISGTTNLPAGEGLLFQINSPNSMNDYNVSINPRTAMETGNMTGVVGCTRVENGSRGENQWAFTFESYFFHPGPFEVRVSNYNYETDSWPNYVENTSASEYFILHP